MNKTEGKTRGSKELSAREKNDLASEKKKKNYAKLLDKWILHNHLANSKTNCSAH